MEISRNMLCVKSIPGFALATIVSFLASILAVWLGENILGFEKSPISEIMMAIILGMLVANTIDLPDYFGSGLKFCTSFILRFGIMLLGIRLSLFSAGKFTLIAIPFVLASITVGLLIVRFLGRKMNLSLQLTGLIAIGKNSDLKIVHEGCKYPDSLGLLYSAITAYLGWRHHCDEGIVMGLATYGDSNNRLPGQQTTYKEIFSQIIEVTNSYSYHINREWIAYHRKRDTWVSDKFIEVFGPGRGSDSEINQHHMDIAAGLQDRLETIVVDQLRHARDSTSLTKLCLSGGVALNCSMNGKIEQSNLFDEIFVQPASGDAGVAAGACYLAQKVQHPDLRPKKMYNFFLGSKFDDHEVRTAFSEAGIDPQESSDLSRTIAKKLHDGKIIGWFQGGAEFGPRALGNRSILTRPFPAGMKDYLNARVKFREEFRPFAPAILVEHYQEFFSIGQQSPHMLIACQATEKAKKEIPATVHVDDSCRVQTVTPELNPPFYALLEAFYEESGCPVLLNTSFNIKGQPIVNTPKQAIECFLGTKIDCLVIGSYFLEK